MVQTAVITGSTRGIGLATAKLFLTNGHNVVISSESEVDVRQTALDLEEYANQVLALRCDISCLEDIAHLIKETLARFTAIDIWINNAAAQGTMGTTYQLPLEQFSFMVDVNIKGSFYGSIKALRLFERQGQGKLINIVGRGDKGPVPLSANYSSTKYWLAGMTKVLAKENNNRNIGICTYNPGLVRTQRTEQVLVLKGEEAKVKALPKVVGILGSETAYPAELLYRIAMKPASSINGKAFKTSYLRAVIDNMIHKKPPHNMKVLSIDPEQDVD